MTKELAKKCLEHYKKGLKAKNISELEDMNLDKGICYVCLKQFEEDVYISDIWRNNTNEAIGYLFEIPKNLKNWNEIIDSLNFRINWLKEFIKNQK